MAAPDPALADGPSGADVENSQRCDPRAVGLDQSGRERGIVESGRPDDGARRAGREHPATASAVRRPPATSTEARSPTTATIGAMSSADGRPARRAPRRGPRRGASRAPGDEPIGDHAGSSE